MTRPPKALVGATEPAALEVIDDAVRAVSVLNPIRRRLLTELIVPDSAAGLARRLKLVRQAVTYHVRQLEAGGLVRVVEERRRGNCVERLVQATARSYVISPAALGPLGVDPEQIRDRFSSTYLIAVAARTIREVAKLRKLADQGEKRVTTLALQTEVRFATPADKHAFATELANALASLAMKYHREQAPDGRGFSVAITGYPTALGSNVPAIPEGRPRAVPALRRTRSRDLSDAAGRGQDLHPGSVPGLCQDRLWNLPGRPPPEES